jgi:hypothetical protein
MLVTVAYVGLYIMSIVGLVVCVGRCLRGLPLVVFPGDRTRWYGMGIIASGLLWLLPALVLCYLTQHWGTV